MKTDTSHSAAAPVVTRLEWDTRHFGFPVGRIEGAVADEPALRRLLSEARDADCAMVYWFAGEQRSISDELLREFGGRIVCRRVTYAREIGKGPSFATPPVTPYAAAGRGDAGESPATLAPPTPALPPRGAERGGAAARAVSIAAYPRRDPDPQLLRLAVEAGALSRFTVDDRFPPAKVRQLYEIWMSRSTLGEFADAVFVATGPGGEPAGMITVVARAAAAEIGLVAVDSECRGRGVGTALLRAADAWALERRLVRVSVVTQLENEAACRLYERAGFQVAAIDQVCHFGLEHDLDRRRNDSGRKAAP